jgi:thioredoxin 1
MMLTEQNFEQEVLQYDGPVLVDFFATWCMSCTFLAPTIDKLSEEMKDTKVKIAKVDVDASPELATKYEILSIPTLFIFNKGQVVESLHGAQNADVLKEKLEALLK